MKVIVSVPKPLRSPCKHRSLDREKKKGANMSWENEKVPVSSDILRNSPSTGGCSSTAGQRKGQHQLEKHMCPVTRERQTALTSDELSIFRVQQILKPLTGLVWFKFRSHRDWTCLGNQKDCPHAEATHSGNRGSRSLPVNPSHKCCLKWRWGDMEGPGVNWWL